MCNYTKLTLKRLKSHLTAEYGKLRLKDQLLLRQLISIGYLKYYFAEKGESTMRKAKENKNLKPYIIISALAVLTSLTIAGTAIAAVRSANKAYALTCLLYTSPSPRD